MKINREDLLRVLQAVEPGLSAKGDTTEQSTCFAFRNGMVLTFNNDVACRCKSGLSKEEKGAVQAKPLLEILQKRTEEWLDVSLDKQYCVITRKGRRTRVRMEEEILLPLDQLEKPTTWVGIPDDFPDAVSLVCECAGRDEQNYFEFSCVNIHPAWLEATDRLQACRYKIKTGVKEPVLVKQKSLKNVVTSGANKLSETDGWVHFKNPSDLILSCRRYVEEAREYVTSDITKALKIEGDPFDLPKGLKETLECCDVFSSESGLANRVIIKLDGTHGKMQITGEGVFGDHTEPKSIKYAGRTLEFMISPELLMKLVGKQVDCQITENRLLAKSGKWRYVSKLWKTGDNKQEEV